MIRRARSRYSRSTGPKPKGGGMGKVNEQMARSILGTNFIFLDEMATLESVSYSRRIRERFEKTFPSPEKLLWCKSNNYAIVPGPMRPLSLLDIRVWRKDMFHPKG